MFGIFSTNQIEKQICTLHVKGLECLEVHNEIKQSVFEFKTELKRMQYRDISFQEAINKAYREVMEHNADVNKRILSTKKYLQNYASRL